MKGVKQSLLCRLCSNQRFEVELFLKYVTCPQCGTEWKVKWLDDKTATIIGPKSWNQWWRKWA